MRSLVSQVLAQWSVGIPNGWSICGLLGLIACCHPWLRPVAYMLDWVLNDKDHCHEAMLRSIRRAGENT